VPVEQLVTATAPGAGQKAPMGHAAHAAAPAWGAYVPIAQGAQLVGEEAPREGRAVPGGQGAGAATPPPQVDPAGQGTPVALLPPTGQKLPGAAVHEEHGGKVVAAASRNVPFAHAVQLVGGDSA
jgi:hypothetical protein